VLAVWEWFDRLRLWVLVGIIGIILLVEGDVTARIIGSVMVALVLGSIILRARHRFANHSQ
jgi:hypothetical protein